MGCSAHFHFYNESSFLIFRVLTKTVLPIFMTFNKDWGGSVGLMIQIMVCAQTSIKLNLIIFLIDVPLAVKLVELMLQG